MNYPTTWRITMHNSILFKKFRRKNAINLKIWYILYFKSLQIKLKKGYLKNF